VELAAYAVLGVAGGVVSAAFTKILLGIRARFLRFPQKTVWFQPVVGGLVVGLMGWFVPQVLGVGYGYVGEALNGRMAFQLMALLVVLKLLAVTVSYGTGNAGGIFGPLCSLAQCWEAPWEPWRTIFSPPTRRLPAPTHWSEWVLSSPASCALP